MRLKLSGLDVDRLEVLPWDGAQKLLESGDDYVVVETRSRLFREEESLSLPITAGEWQDSLAATVFCQADDADIRAAARGIVGEERNAWRAAKNIAEWVDREVTANYDVGFASAREILDHREGDCSEHTVLFVALCRASGIPARALVGIMYGGGIFAYHMWPEVFVGDWVALDPKWLARDPETGEYFTDATHIVFGRSNLDENMYQEMVTSISEIIGSLELEVLEYSDDGEFK
jgi:transglutaminase-like putative cysteine protease